MTQSQLQLVDVAVRLILAPMTVLFGTFTTAPLYVTVIVIAESNSACHW
jgi:hypothetical protein